MSQPSAAPRLTKARAAEAEVLSCSGPVLEGRPTLGLFVLPVHASGQLQSSAGGRLANGRDNCQLATGADDRC